MQDIHTNQVMISTDSIDVVDPDTHRQWRIERVEDSEPKYAHWGGKIKFTDLGTRARPLGAGATQGAAPGLRLPGPFPCGPGC